MKRRRRNRRLLLIFSIELRVLLQEVGTLDQFRTTVCAKKTTDFEWAIFFFKGTTTNCSVLLYHVDVISRVMGQSIFSSGLAFHFYVKITKIQYFEILP